MMLDIFHYYIINEWEKLINLKDEKNIISFTTPILTTIRIYFRSSKFLEERPFEIRYHAGSAIYKRCSNLDWCDNHEKKVLK